MAGLVLLIVALVLFALATFNVNAPFNLTAAGLFCGLLAIAVGVSVPV